VGLHPKQGDPTRLARIWSACESEELGNGVVA
jgi:hypothetical protein